MKLITLCYNKKIIVRIFGSVPPPLTWHISKVLIEVFFPVVNVCVMNQSRGHWLLLDALFVAITMTCKFRKEAETNLFVDGLMEKHVVIGVELDFLASNLKR
jgi:hypothetical protein